MFLDWDLDVRCGATACTMGDGGWCGAASVATKTTTTTNSKATTRNYRNNKAATTHYTTCNNCGTKAARHYTTTALLATTKDHCDKTQNLMGSTQGPDSLPKCQIYLTKSWTSLQETTEDTNSSAQQTVCRRKCGLYSSDDRYQFIIAKTIG